jgi:hypothetical protein
LWYTTRMQRALVLLVGVMGCSEARIFECASCGGQCTDEFIPSKSARHIDGSLSYEDFPPAGGDHNACWSTWGVHTESVPTERWVHNLEHGGVVFLYDCPDGCQAEIDALTALVNSLPEGRAILSPASGMPSPFAAISWENRLLLGCIDLTQLRAFFTLHVAQAPEDTTSDPPSDCPP